MTCIVEGCENPSRNRVAPGLCRMHHERKRKHGDVGPPHSLRPRIPVEQKIRQRHRVTAEGCWEWTRGRDKNGYGFVTGGGSKLAHRVSYEVFVGPIPEGLTLDHLCRNTSCINPDHLEPVTHRENVLRGKVSRLRDFPTHCKNGHPYDEANTYWLRGARQCKACAALRNRRYRARQRLDEPA